MMRGSLDKPRNKAALEKIQPKRAREHLTLSQGETPPDHDSQQRDANMESSEPRDNVDQLKTSKLKPRRGNLDTDQSQAKVKMRSQEGNTNMDAVSVPNTLSLDKTHNNSFKRDFERLKLKPLRRRLQTSESQTKLLDNGEKSSTKMDTMALPDMLRFLEKEEALLTRLQSKVSDELSRLQVEEHIFLHTLKILGQKHASTNKVKDQPETSSGNQDLIDALNEALMESGESVPRNEEKSEGMSEEPGD